MVSLLPGKDVTSQAGSKTTSLVLREREDPGNEAVTNAGNMKCRLLKTSMDREVWEADGGYSE